MASTGSFRGHGLREVIAGLSMIGLTNQQIGDIVRMTRSAVSGQLHRYRADIIKRSVDMNKVFSADELARFRRDAQHKKRQPRTPHIKLAAPKLKASPAFDDGLSKYFEVPSPTIAARSIADYFTVDPLPTADDKPKKLPRTKAKVELVVREAAVPVKRRKKMIDDFTLPPSEAAKVEVEGTVVNVNGVNVHLLTAEPVPSKRQKNNDVDNEFESEEDDSKLFNYAKKISPYGNIDQLFAHGCVPKKLKQLSQFGECKVPLGRDDDGDYVYCAQPVHEDSRFQFCTYHSRYMLRPPTYRLR